MGRFIAALVALICCVPAYAASLALAPYWLKLLHYEGEPARSAVHDPDFFLAPDGAHDPASELAASLRALGSAPGLADSHFRCRFPARAAWLDQQRGDTPELDRKPGFDLARHCPRYHAWTRQGRIRSVSVVFASGYLGNPASYYGHTLFKFNAPGDDPAAARLLDSTVNYGAIVDRQDNPVVYILKGLFGGYDAGFSHIDFYFHQHQYGENELRDLWEYELNLTPAETAAVVAHAWEVLGKRHVYYFLRENCAYRMARVLELADGLDLVPPNRPYTLPQALMQRLAASARAGQPLVADIRHHPSRQSRFHARLGALDRADTTLFKDLAGERLHFASAAYTDAAPERQRRVVDAVLDYHRVRDGALEKSPTSPHWRAALAERFRLPPAAAAPIPVPAAAPHTGRPPGWVQLLALDRAEGRTLGVRVRPAYYDALDGDTSHVAWGGLAMGEMQFGVRRGRLRLERLDLIAIDSVDPDRSGLPGDRGFAWKLRGGLDAASANCPGCALLRVQADAGFGRRLGEAAFAAIYLGGALQDKRHGEALAFVRASADFIVRPAPSFAFKLGVEQRQPLSRRRDAATFGKLEARWGFDPRADLRLQAEYGDAVHWGVGVGAYW